MPEKLRPYLLVALCVIKVCLSARPKNQVARLSACLKDLVKRHPETRVLAEECPVEEALGLAEEYPVEETFKR